MESYIVKSQLNELRTLLVKDIQSTTATDTEQKLFSNIVVFLYKENPDMVCNAYGLRQGVLLFDCMNASLEAVDLNVVPLDSLLRIKEELEYFEKSKQYSSGRV